jgi:hypothetical protein
VTAHHREIVPQRGGVEGGEEGAHCLKDEGEIRKEEEERL